ncbi:MAG: alpha/beta hydrolase [Planctomycetes bacterium]|jgi:pimeloyl-ACP methyl ester carboxylesterase|nr:alpha/beta hydrolase [Planctomycetota bacterium]
MQKKQIIVNNLKITYFISDRFDPKQAAVFLPGWNSTADLLLKIIGETNNFIALNLPGFGGSEKPKQTWGLLEYANFLKSFLEKLEIIKPILIGHSFGGALAVKYVANNKSTESSVKKIILIDSSAIRQGVFNLKKKIYWLGAKIFKTIVSLPFLKSWGRKMRKKFYKSIDSPDYLEAGPMVNIYQKIIKEDLQSELATLDIPVAIIWGRNDKDTPFNQGELTHKLIKNSQFFPVSNAGHYVFLDQPEEFKKIFFAQLWF